MTAREILKEMFPNIPVSGGKDMVDYDWKQFKTHREESTTERQWTADGAIYCSYPTWIDFLGWTYDCGFRIHRDKVTFWAKYWRTYDWMNMGTRIQEWTVYIV